ncbi:hypothetical protein [Micromonospora sp. CNB394]|uniref:hypothetical protein n=1 Tax=Micromonospora sp. CNB394 TaxID=1169151 RepID=UPI0003613B78|nr:hypothetical protein [Micromonospora sp. CNB394]
MLAAETGYRGVIGRLVGVGAPAPTQADLSTKESRQAWLRAVWAIGVVGANFTVAAVAAVVLCRRRP